MQLKAFTRIKSFLFIAVSDCDREEFGESINKINLSRGKLTAVMFVSLETMLLATMMITKKGSALAAPNLYYVGMYLAMLVAMLAFLLVFIRMTNNVSEHRTGIQIVKILFTGFILCWCAGISLLDQMSSGQIMVYVVAVIAVAVTPLLEPVVLFLIYLFVHVAFLVPLIYFQPDAEIPFGMVTNSTTFVMVSWAISYMRYKKQVMAFNNEKMIQEKNIELARINAELKQANQKLERISRIDGLTGIHNRAMFDLTIQAEWDRCRRQLRPLSLLMIDIDYFKAYNDHYGHQAGDRCIQRVAQVLSARTKRASDSAARYGGEEFAVILPYIEREEANAIAEQMRSGVEDLAIPHAYSLVSDYLTISLGVYTAAPSDCLTVEAFIKCADDALYRAKTRHNGVATA